jgi:hypothetical protein
MQRARRRRRLTTAMVAARAQISRPTLLRVERGDGAVSLGVYATVLWVLGLGDRLSRLAASETDLVGIGLEDERLPQRVSSGRRRSSKSRPTSGPRSADSDTSKLPPGPGSLERRGAHTASPRPSKPDK